MLPFSGFSVVELGSRISSGFCGKLLSNFGAEVTLIEGPEGNPIRRYGLLEDDSANGHSGLFGYLHAGKQSVSIAQKDFESLKRLVRSADVLIFGASNDPTIRQAVQGSGHTANFRIRSFDTNAPYAINGLYIDYTPANRR